MKDIKVSIIVPVYNVEKYIDKCLNSLLSQSYKNIEIIAVSDGSPDNSKEIILNYSKKDNRIKFFEKENGGYGSVLEYAISKITSEYFLICDPDDWLKEDCIEKLVMKAFENNLDLLVGCKNIVYLNDSKEHYSDSYIPNVEMHLEENKLYVKDDLGFLYLEPSPHSKLFKTSVCKDIKLPHKVNHTDLLLYVYAFENAKRKMFVKDALSCYLIDRPGNSTTTFKDKVFYDNFVIIKELLEIAKRDPRLYARIYLQFRYVLTMLKHNGSKIAKERFFSEYLYVFKELSNNKKYVSDYFYNQDLVFKLKCQLLLTDFCMKKKLLMLMGANKWE